MLNCLCVGIGGFIGAVLRYLVGFLPLKSDGGFPIKTLLINVIGAFAISLITALAVKNKSDPHIILLLNVGVCGGFTTFSTFAYETASLLQKNAAGTAFTYAILSVVLCVAAIFGAKFCVR
ncbi:MAG: fluoride efflux transporter CrcB [Bacillota bacterium]|nr:fluoride efflux transporter CrcB [Bacillota bacterium]